MKVDWHGVIRCQSTVLLEKCMDELLKYGVLLSMALGKVQQHQKS